MEPVEKLITAQELSEIINIKPRTITRLRIEQGLPRLKIGRQVRFRLSEVMAWIEKQKVG